MRHWFSFDRILELQQGKHAKAICNISNTLAIFETHFPLFPVLPGVLMLDSIVNLGIHLLQAQTDKQWRVQGVKQVSFRHFVQPGDQMQLEVEVKNLEANIAHLSGKVLVEGKCMATVRHIHLEVYS